MPDLPNRESQPESRPLFMIYDHDGEEASLPAAPEKAGDSAAAGEIPEQG